MRKYFVSYYATTKTNGFTFGNTEFSTSGNLFNQRTRDFFKRLVIDENPELSSLVILYFKRKWF